MGQPPLCFSLRAAVAALFPDLVSSVQLSERGKGKQSDGRLRGGCRLGETLLWTDCSLHPFYLCVGRATKVQCSVLPSAEGKGRRLQRSSAPSWSSGPLCLALPLQGTRNICNVDDVRVATRHGPGGGPYHLGRLPDSQPHV